ncbi:MAG: rhomboid family intramembrane serine protease [Okeania sp. SIO3B5]|uniref:rhomboid family intramembrane serine protease n=1 Tax=Okeania sp. SIO3B5 TaxID=2607811 RepID=UPI00140130D5|nr:rhomboid family intramembrane serine protease [Okeania sp. SIO3B5]NEO56368.1 rhomboid family intramembrane serine protease [Okeania sp. SIO3B5]
MNKLFEKINTQVTILGSLIAILWILQIINSELLAGTLNNYGGIHPQSSIGFTLIRSIFLAPFLHGSYAHLMANIPPLIILGWLIMLRGFDDFFFVSIVTIIVSGLGIWCVGAPNSVHIGASGLIFGYFGFLLLRSLFDFSVLSVIFALTAGFLYSGLIWGILPSDPNISWEAHLFGFLGGIFAAQLLGKRKKNT